MSCAWVSHYGKLKGRDKARYEQLRMAGRRPASLNAVLEHSNIC